MRCGWELSVLVYGLHARRDGLEVGRMCIAAGVWGVWCGIVDGVCADAGCVVVVQLDKKTLLAMAAGEDWCAVVGS